MFSDNLSPFQFSENEELFTRQFTSTGRLTAKKKFLERMKKMLFVLSCCFKSDTQLKELEVS